MDLQEVQPADAIEPSWLEEYERKISLLWQELMLLNSNLYVLEKLSKFPIRLFTDPLRGNFIDIVAINLSDICAVSIWKLWLDKDEESLTLVRFGDDVMEHVRPEYRLALDATLENLECDEHALERVKKIRHKRIAHFDSKCNLSPQERRKLWLLLPDLTNLRDTLCSLFGVLCFGCGRLLLPLPYDPKVQRPPGIYARSDVEVMLDTIARDSALVNMPEKQPRHWAVYRGNLSADELRVLNEYRRNFGLQDV